MRRNRARGGGPRRNDAPEPFDARIVAAVSELAVARALNLFWEPFIGPYYGGDVGGRVEVRLRRQPGFGELTMLDTDKDERPFVLVHWSLDERDMHLVGWLYGAEAKERAHERGQWCDKKQCWFVPGPYRPIETLIEQFASARASEPRATNGHLDDGLDEFDEAALDEFAEVNT